MGCSVINVLADKQREYPLMEKIIRDRVDIVAHVEAARPLLGMQAESLTQIYGYECGHARPRILTHLPRIGFT